MKPFNNIYVSSINFVLKTGSSRVTLSGCASFIKVNGKDWVVGQSICARGMHVSNKKELRNELIYALTYHPIINCSYHMGEREASYGGNGKCWHKGS